MNRRARSRAFGWRAAVAAATTVSCLVSGTAAARADTSADVVVDSDVDAISEDGGDELEQAEATGVPVVVEDWTTETTEVSALPTGEFRAAISASPSRKYEGDDWVDLDSTLVKRSDGMLEPVSAIGDLVLSGGGAANSVLARIGEGDTTAVIHTPFDLPAPTLHDDTAVYAEVLPGVDLVTAATTSGFTFNWVVKNRAAADDPRVRELSLPVELDGVSANPERGGFSFDDASGVPQFWAPTPTMWDSSGAPSADPESGESNETSLEAVEQGPDIEDRLAKVSTTVTDSKITLTPDLALLDSPDVVFPVVIDPHLTHKKTRNGWTAVWSNFPNKSFWQTDHSLGAGYEGFEQMKIVRSYFRFDTTAIRGKYIIAADLKVRQIHAASCQARPTDAYRTRTIGTGTTWNAQPTRLEYQGSRSSTAGCGSGTAMVGWNILTGARKLAAENATSGTFMLRARDEGDKIAWKQFDDAEALIEVQYVSRPAVPTSLTIRAGAAKPPCGTSTAPAMVGSTSIVIGATVTSADGDRATLNAVFRRRDMEAPADMADIGGGSGPSGSASTITWSGLVNNHIYRYNAKGRVSWSYNDVPGYIDSNGWAASWCYFKVDTTLPPQPTVDSTDFGECASAVDPDDCTSRGQAGVAGQFTVGTDLENGGTDAVSYWWTLNGGSLNSVSANLADPSRLTTIAVTPGAIMNTFTVYSKDAAGNKSAVAIRHFKVDPRRPDVEWKFDDPSDAGKDSGRLQTSPLSIPVPTLAPIGRLGSGLAFAGGNPAASPITSTSGVSTSSSFTIGAWVRIDSPGSATATTLLAGNGTQGNAFEFGYEPSTGKWTAGRRSATAVVNAVSASATPHVWTHLSATYNVSTNTVTLFVNGRKVESKTYPSAAWSSTAWQVGCSSLVTTATSCGAGQVDHISLYSAVLAADEIEDLADPVSAGTTHRVTSKTGRWLMDDAATSTTAIDDCFDNDLTLTAGAGFVENDGVRALRFSGVVSQTAKTGRAVVDSTGSFTVAAKVRLSADPSTSVIAQQLGAQGGQSWSLRYVRTDTIGRWVFQRAASDDPGAPVTSVASRPVDDPTELTTLVATYDRKEGKIALYVGGKRIYPDDDEGAAFEASIGTPWAARGGVSVGNGLIGGVNQPMTGDIERLDIFAGEFGDDQAREYESRATTVVGPGTCSSEDVGN